MTRRLGTVHMLNVALRYLLTTYGDEIDQIVLDDSSTTQCDFNGKPEFIDLMFSYISLHAKTWYESKFNAVPENSIVRDAYLNKYIPRLTDSDFKKRFTHLDLNINYSQDRISYEVMDTCHKLFDTSNTLLDFFRSLQSKYGKQYCVVTYRWLDLFMSSKVFEGLINPGMKWIIPKEAVKQIVDLEVTHTTDVPKDIEFDQDGGGARKRQAYHASNGDVSAQFGWRLPR